MHSEEQHQPYVTLAAAGRSPAATSVTIATVIVVVLAVVAILLTVIFLAVVAVFARCCHRPCLLSSLLLPSPLLSLSPSLPPFFLLPLLVDCCLFVILAVVVVLARCCRHPCRYCFRCCRTHCCHRRCCHHCHCHHPCHSSRCLF